MFILRQFVLNDTGLAHDNPGTYIVQASQPLWVCLVSHKVASHRAQSCHFTAEFFSGHRNFSKGIQDRNGGYGVAAVYPLTPFNLSCQQLVLVLIFIRDFLWQTLEKLQQIGRSVVWSCGFSSLLSVENKRSKISTGSFKERKTSPHGSASSPLPPIVAIDVIDQYPNLCIPPHRPLESWGHALQGIIYGSHVSYNVSISWWFFWELL